MQPNGQNWASLKLSHAAVGIQELAPSSAAFPDDKKGAGLEMELPKQKLEPPKDAHTTGGDVTYYAMPLIPRLVFFKCTQKNH